MKNFLAHKRKEMRRLGLLKPNRAETPRDADEKEIRKIKKMPK